MLFNDNTDRGLKFTPPLTEIHHCTHTTLLLSRHAYGDQYRASDMVVSQPGKLELSFTPAGELIMNFLLLICCVQNMPTLLQCPFCLLKSLLNTLSDMTFIQMEALSQSWTCLSSSREAVSAWSDAAVSVHCLLSVSLSGQAQ